MEDSKWNIIQRFLRGQLSGVEMDDFNTALEDDDEMMSALRFEMQLREGQNKYRANHLRKHLERRNLIRNIKRIAVVTLVLILAILALYITLKPSPPLFTPEEGRALFKKAIAQNDVFLIPQASEPILWKEEIREVDVDVDKRELVIQALVEEIASAPDPCRPSTAVFFLGMIQFYLENDFDTAAPLINCVDKKESRNVNDDLQIPLILLAIHAGNDKEVERLLKAFNMVPTDLPLLAQKKLERMH